MLWGSPKSAKAWRFQSFSPDVSREQNYKGTITDALKRTQELKWTPEEILYTRCCILYTRLRTNCGRSCGEKGTLIHKR